jgi:mannosyltransferase
MSTQIDNLINSKKWLLFPVFLFALLLRIIGLQSRPIWYDDAFSVFLSRQSLGDIITGTAVDTAPPLYYFLLHYWMLIGQQVWFLRSLNVVLSLFVLILAYFWIRDLFGHNQAVLTSLFIAVSPLQIYHAQELRMYTLMALSLLGYFYFLTRVWKQEDTVRSNRWNWIGVVVFGVLAMYSHNLVAFILVVPNFFFLIKRNYRKLFYRLIFAQLLILALAIPWLLMLPMQLDKIQTAFYTVRPGLVEIIQIIIIFHTNLPLPPTLLTVAAVVSVQLISVIIIETLKVGRRDENVLFISLVIVLPAVLLFVASYLMRPLFVARGLIFSSLAYLALAAYVVIRAHDRRIGVALGLAFFLLPLVVLPNHYTYANFPRSPFKEATVYLQSVVLPGDIILHDNKLSYFPLHFHSPELPQVFLPDEPGSHNDTLAPATQDAMRIYPAPDIESVVSASSRVWYILFDRAIDEYLAAGYDNHPNLAWLESNFDLFEFEEINDLLIFGFTH